MLYFSIKTVYLKFKSDFSYSVLILFPSTGKWGKSQNVLMDKHGEKVNSHKCNKSCTLRHVTVTRRPDKYPKAQIAMWSIRALV